MEGVVGEGGSELKGHFWVILIILSMVVGEQALLNPKSAPYIHIEIVFCRFRVNNTIVGRTHTAWHNKKVDTRISKELGKVLQSCFQSFVEKSRIY